MLNAIRQPASQDRILGGASIKVWTHHRLSHLFVRHFNSTTYLGYRSNVALAIHISLVFMQQPDSPFPNHRCISYLITLSFRFGKSVSIQSAEFAWRYNANLLAV
ncbi:MAG TPA: hypothetical protein DEF07_04475 [Nitrosomonas sp.]|nr:hypothetical protein [Nitrosomonas sp.]